MTTPIHDLHVSPTSDSLSGKHVDVVVSGSIAAVESIRFIRSLRRLGAEVTAWLSQGGAQFITPMSLAWACGKEPVTGFSGSATHIATSDCVVVAPASSNIIAKIARGMTDTHCTALIASALGQKKPVILMPTMHDSLKSAPAMLEHLEKIASWPMVQIIGAREEEGKQKFPEPDTLADQCSHITNKAAESRSPILLTMGTTRGYIDDVRYVSNYSSGKLGSLICEELYRQGFSVNVVAGPSEHRPRVANELHDVQTTAEMLRECEIIANRGVSGAIFCASVLDYEPSEKTLGKLRSGQDNLTISFKPTPKIIEKIQVPNNWKIGFKLEVGLSEEKIKQIASQYITKYSLKALIVNELTAVSASKHTATACVAEKNTIVTKRLKSKMEIARFITGLLAQQT